MNFIDNLYCYIYLCTIKTVLSFAFCHAFYFDYQKFLDVYRLAYFFQTKYSKGNIAYQSSK